MSSTGFCQDNWYKMIIYPGQSSQIASSVPAKIAGQNCSTTTTTPAPIFSNGNEEVDFSNLADEAIIFVPITMVLGLLFLILVLCRSRSRTQIDWYRLIAIYIGVTLGVPISIELAPSGGGFNRVIGFGILVHNLGELVILSHVWFGTVGNVQGRNRISGVLAILYVWFIMGLICFLQPLWLLFLILMIQGSFCDYALVGTFIYLGRILKNQQLQPENVTIICGKPVNYTAFGIAAALTHILSIQPLFYSMAIPTFVIGGAITIIFLMPTFILYIVFSSADKDKVPRVLEITLNEANYELNLERNLYLKQLVDEQNQKQSVLAQRNNNGRYPELYNVINGGTQASKHKVPILKSSFISFDDIINEGLIYMKLPDGVNARRAIKIVIAVAATVCITNSFIVLFAPCYISTPC